MGSNIRVILIAEAPQQPNGAPDFWKPAEDDSLNVSWSCCLGLEVATKAQRCIRLQSLREAQVYVLTCMRIPMYKRLHAQHQYSGQQGHEQRLLCRKHTMASTQV